MSSPTDVFNQAQGLGSQRAKTLAEIGLIPESRNWNRSDLDILVCHEDGPCDVDPSRSRALPELDASWNTSQKARAEIIAEIEDWILSGDG